MLLADLNPRWCSVDGRRGMGVTFDCPHCRVERLAVWFKEPLDGGPPYAGVDDEHRWHRTGDTLDTITLVPSIDASNAGHWHGYITSGEIA